MAQRMGKTELAKEYYKRSQNYRNVFNPATGFMQPIDDKGIFQPDFNPDEYTALFLVGTARHQRADFVDGWQGTVCGKIG